MMVTTTGSLFLWSVRPAKIIQPLAPYFHEIEENIEYCEREGEFDEHLECEEESLKGLSEEDKKKAKLAKTNIDIETMDPYHLCTPAQITALQRGTKDHFSQIFDS